jgi:hypothetical protein
LIEAFRSSLCGDTPVTNLSSFRGSIPLFDRAQAGNTFLSQCPTERPTAS